MRVLVTGATGGVGSEVLGRLLAEGVPVRATSRDPATARVPVGVVLVMGDLNEPGSMTRALEGVSSVFLYVQGKNCLNSWRR
jgi:uncharacterized protein YbjT (DUF2867 family)